MNLVTVVVICLIPDNITQKIDMNTLTHRECAYDFSNKEYSFVKTHMGNGKMIEAIINSIEEGRLPLPEEIVKYVESYMNSIVFIV